MSAESEQMNEEFFRRMAATYGGNLQRWPEDIRRKAQDRFETHHQNRSLGDAQRLDKALDLYEVPQPSAALIGSILSAGTRLEKRRLRLRRLLIGAGLLGVGLAGGLTGAIAVTTIAPAPQLYGSDTITAFGKVPTESELMQEAQ